MNILNDLTAGLESFMDDVSVDVEVKEPEEQAVVETAAETEESVADTQEVQAEGDEDAAAAEMIFMQYDELFRMHDYLEAHGADKAFMSLYNADGEYAQALQINLPSCESFDVVGDPNSAETLACLEAEKGFFRKIWDWLVKMFKKIANFLGNLFQSIKLFFTNVNKRIAKLRDLYEDRDDNPKFKGKFKGVNKKDKIEAKLKEVDAILAEALKEAQAVSHAFEKTLQVNGSGVTLSGLSEKTVDIDKKGESGTGDKFKSNTKAEQLSRQLDQIKALKYEKEIDEKDFTWADVKTTLNQCSNMQSEIEKDNAQLAALKTMSDKMAQLSENAAQRSGEKDDNKLAKKAKSDASEFNKLQNVVTKALGFKVKAINVGLRTCQWRILKGGKKKAA